MLEQGLVALVNANSAVTAIAAKGGVLSTLPPNAAYPTWTYRMFGLMPVKGLQILDGGGSKVNCQIDVYGTARADVINLTQAIKAVLHGFRGTLSDPDSTYVDGCFLIDLRDLDEDADARVFRRMSEYEIRFSLK
jgi:hypothetical protein